ncbi:Response regulator of zinc sigma-54-dependent two-component system [Olavius algarvensis associated proteobacterium Delta 3]|nr:Response regulator of zinc sigma-54-dependent two-component system [Olavius algarvensis associated proteobacterium Delta 3]
MLQGKILAIDDEKNIRHLIQNEFTLEDFDVTTAGSGEEGLVLFDAEAFDVVLLDLKLPHMSGLETLTRLKQKAPFVEVIMITGYGDIHSAVEAIKLGARGYVTKPFKLDELLALVSKAVQDNRRRSKTIPVDEPPRVTDTNQFLLCPSPSMQKVYSLVEKVGPTDSTVLIQGETGVGKDVLAEYIHRNSLSRDGPFVILDCGLLTRTLAESELYGHKKGAFSGASEGRIGLVEKSHGGTLFLDEIGNIDLDLQKKFLRFLETGKIRRLGETREIQIDTRIVLATNLSLDEAVREGKIRSDLFYRMAAFSISLEPLRKRPEDILPLSRHFFLNIAAGNRTAKALSKPAAELLTAYPWPGNIRELKATMNKLNLLTNEDTVLPEHLPAHLQLNIHTLPQSNRTLEDIEKEHIINILAETGGNQSRAAKILGINRKTLYKKIHKFKIFS